MCDGFNHGALQIAVAQICQSMGWDALQKSTHDLLTEVLQKYLEEIAKSAHGYCQLCKLSYIYISFLYPVLSFSRFSFYFPKYPKELLSEDLTTAF